MNRSEYREETFKFLYSLQLNKNTDIDEQIDFYLKSEDINEKACITYLKNTIKGINENESEIIKLIEKNIKEGWTISRISKVDLTLLKLGTFEIIYSKIPYKVVINEVVELSKKYGDDNSKAFINGVLATIVKENESNNSDLQTENEEKNN